MYAKYVLSGVVVAVISGCATAPSNQYAVTKPDCKVVALQTTSAKTKDTSLDDRLAQARLASMDYYQSRRLSGQPNALEDALRDCY